MLTLVAEGEGKEKEDEEEEGGKKLCRITLGTKNNLVMGAPIVEEEEGTFTKIGVIGTITSAL
jgi:hypothetical protein